MKKVNVKRILGVAKILPFVAFGEILLFGTAFSFLAFFLVSLPVLMIRCKNCNTPILDNRIALKDTGGEMRMLDECPVCGQPMI